MTSGRGKKNLFFSPCVLLPCVLFPLVCFMCFGYQKCVARKEHITRILMRNRRKRTDKGKSSSSGLCVMYHSLSVFPLLYTTRVARVTEGKSTGEDVGKLPFHDQL